jgi:hypothetical protein
MRLLSLLVALFVTVLYVVGSSGHEDHHAEVDTTILPHNVDESQSFEKCAAHVKTMCPDFDINTQTGFFESICFNDNIASILFEENCRRILLSLLHQPAKGNSRCSGVCSSLEPSRRTFVAPRVPLLPGRRALLLRAAAQLAGVRKQVHGREQGAVEPRVQTVLRNALRRKRSS